MAGMSVGGLVSGMDTSTIISQLMEIEKQPQALLETRMSSAQSQATAYRAVNTRFAALRTAAEALTSDAAWKSVKATSSSATVSATAASGASTGSLAFAVDRVSTAHSVVSDATWAGTNASYGSALSITSGGTTTNLTLGGTGTLADAVKAINDSGLGLTATAIKVNGTDYRLQVTTKDTGAATSFTVGAPDSFDVVTQGQDAQLTVGTGPGKYTMTSATNTFTGLLDGTTLTVTEPAASVTVKVADDPQAIANKVSALVSAANGLLDAITSYTSAASKSAALKGDSTLRQLSGDILDTVSRVLGADGSLAAVGLELTRTGKFEFDATTFTAKMTADPAVVQRMFTQTSTTNGPDGVAGGGDDITSPVGLAARLATLAKTASDATTGTLTLLATGKDTTAKDLQKRIDAWDIRLDLRETALTRQFTAMEKALSTLQNQSSWLSSQISSLPSWSSSSK